MRKTEGSMICPQCGKLISVSEPRCPFCDAWNPSLYGYTPAIQRLFGNRLDLAPAVTVACIALYVASLVLAPEAIFRFGGIFDLLSPANRALFQLGMTSRALLMDGWWWTLFTAIFLHGGILHIFFNVMWVRNLGPAVSSVYGPARSVVIFMLSGALGFLVSDLASPNPSIGASGSIFGLLAALIVYGRRHGGTAITAQLWQWAVIMFAMGFFMSGVNNWAHAGGFAGGWLVAQSMRLDHERREGRGAYVLALLLLAITVVGIGLSFVRVTGMILMR